MPIKGTEGQRRVVAGEDVVGYGMDGYLYYSECTTFTKARVVTG